MKQSYCLIKEVRIHETEEGFEILKPEEVLYIQLNKEKSTSKSLLFEAMTVKGKVDIKITFDLQTRDYNTTDCIKIINAEMFVCVSDPYNLGEITEVYSLVHCSNCDTYINVSTDFGYNDGYGVSLITPIGKKYYNNNKIKTLECTPKCIGEIQMNMNNTSNNVLFYSFDGKFDQKIYYFDNKGNKYFTNKIAIEKEYNIIKADC